MKLIVNIWVKIKLGQRNQVLNVKYKINASLIEIEIVVWWESKIYYEGISWSWNLELTRYVCIVVTADNLYILVDRSSNSTHRYINFTCCCVRFCWKVLVSSPPSSSSKKSWQNGECEKRRRCCESIAVSNAILIELMIDKSFFPQSRNKMMICICSMFGMFIVIFYICHCILSLAEMYRMTSHLAETDGLGKWILLRLDHFGICLEVLIECGVFSFCVYRY